ncbi:MAG: PorP/SprF family type IX secretion system membrane protein [Bacteroidetes bacterium]|nr:PorP/SprF family type IX secretion system membrane protein [Bacteroidota bacterium]
MKKGLIIVIMVFICGISSAQQIGMYSHYFYDPMVYNPAFAGSGYATNATLISRNQWTGFKGGPKLTLFTLDGSLIAKKVGAGLTLISDRKGISNRTGGNLSYSYRLNINDNAHLRFGLSVGIMNHTLDFSGVFVETTTFDGNAGMVLVWKELEISAAVPQLIGNRVNYVDGDNIRLYYTQSRHIMSSLKYKFYIVKDKGISIAPQGLVRFMPNTPFQFDGNINLDWKDKFWVGATYKSDYAVSANAGFCLYKRFCLGYSYDFIIGNIGKYSGMAHEIMINFKFNERKKVEVVEEVLKENEPQSAENAEYEELIAKMQAKVDESEKKIKELDAKLKDQNTKTGTNKKPDLNNLLYEQLLDRVEAMFENPKDATPARVQELRNEIAAFLDSEFADPEAQKTLKKQYDQLNKSQDAPSVLVKGGIVLERIVSQGDYSTVSITVTDKETNGIIATYAPNAKTGKYLFILSPGKKYVITITNKGFKTYSEDFSPAESEESYEMNKDIRLKEK